ncbi:hypothetical protein Mgra_00001158 [Meloidogyne graminicola]|uniref:Coiled-coil domain-containing protein 22 homolog n=1 Tax=Meloidogyne graminicola TaxID=189291 RepID=A0A8T0A0D7_9BILA|nr:hypothetical protein Mgra_00001158 [Meloidogyne graminicola]
MENVDQMIFDYFANELNCSFLSNKEFQNLSELGADQIVEGVIRCLWKCNSSTLKTLSNYKMPGNAVDRFKMASKISQEIKSLGINDSQIGYQTFLYPNVFETRRLFLALFERLPKEKVLVDEKILSPLEQLKLNVGELIAKQMTENWTPEFCRFYDLKRIGRFWHTRREDLLQGQAKTFKDVELNLNEAVLEPLEESKIGTKPKLLPKPKIEKPSKASVSDDDQKELFSSVPSSSSQLSTESINLIEKIASKQRILMEKQNVFKKLQNEISQLNDKIQTKQETSNLNDKRILALLEEGNAEENLEKLKYFVTTAEDRRLKLEEKFVEAKAKLIERLESVKSTKKDKLVDETLVNDVDELEEEFERKKRIKAKLLKELQKFSMNENNGIKPENRKKMLDKILEINAMVVKQNEQIRKTALSVQQIRKEIAQLDGILDRTFTAVDRWIGGDKNNLRSNSGTSSPMTISQRENKQMVIIRRQRAYKLLVRTHEQCALITSSIQTQGEMECQIDELTNKIEFEVQKGVDTQIEKLLDDLMVIRTENRELELKVEEMGGEKIEQKGEED